MLREPRADLHDVLEEAYLTHMAAGGGRWFCHRRGGYVLTGFAGLDAPTTSRMGLVNVPEADFPRVLGEGEAYFRGRGLPWSVALTPVTRPESARRDLRRWGFRLAARFGIYTLEGPPTASPARVPEDLRLRSAGPLEARLLTQLTVDGFEMPSRYRPALRDIAESWLAHGAHALVAEWEGEPVGMAMAVEGGGVTGVYNVSVLRRARRLGVGQALMERLLENVAPDGRLVTLQVARGSAAERLYERLGFERRYDWELWSQS